MQFIHQGLNLGGFLFQRFALCFSQYIKVRIPCDVHHFHQLFIALGLPHECDAGGALVMHGWRQ